MNNVHRSAVATPHCLATDAGRTALEAGGNALDAAVTASSVLSVVYPHMTSFAGDLFAVVQFPDGRIVAVNGSGGALPGTVTALSSATEMPRTGPLTITVPGVLSALDQLLALGGRLGLGAALAPARDLAADGVPIAPSVARALVSAPHLMEDPAFANVFARPDGGPLQEGEALIQPALSETIDRLAAEGVEEFYRGALGGRFADGLRERGVPMAAADLAAHATEIANPLVGRLGDLELVTAPPNSQGIVLLRLASVLEQAGLTDGAWGEAVAEQVLATRSVMSERERLLAEPNWPMSRAAADWLSAPPPADDGAPSSLSKASGDTVAVVVADSDGTVVSLIQSVYRQFGSGVLEPSTGLLCHNRGAAFVLDPAHPNVLAPGKRPAHSLLPLIVRRHGHWVAGMGTMGGRAQPQILLQLLVRLFVEGLGPEQALEAPRWVTGDRDLGYPDGVVFVEARASADMIEELRTLPVDCVVRLPFDEEVGHAQVVCRDGALTAASDPRSDGSVVVF